MSGGVRRPTRRVGRHREAHLEDNEGLGGTPGGPGGVGSPPKKAGRGEEALPGGQEGSDSPSGMLGGVGRNQDSPRRARIIGRPSRMAERG